MGDQGICREQQDYKEPGIDDCKEYSKFIDACGYLKNGFSMQTLFAVCLDVSQFTLYNGREDYRQFALRDYHSLLICMKN